MMMGENGMILQKLERKKRRWEKGDEGGIGK
jgi:hypothetical protein